MHVFVNFMFWFHALDKVGYLSAVWYVMLQCFALVLEFAD